MTQKAKFVPELQIFMMGRLAIMRLDANLVTELNKKEQALLCYLKMNGRSCSRRELETLLWPESPKPKVSLRVALNHLRRLDLDAYLDISDEALAFNHENHWSDVAAFTFQLEHFLSGANADLYALTHLLDQMDNTFLADFSISDSTVFEAWKQSQRQLIRRQLVHALELLLQRCWENEDWAHVRQYAERLIAIAPWNDRGQVYLARLQDAASGMAG